MFIEAKPLQGQYVKLELLTTAHIEPLAAAVSDGESWRLWYASVPTPASMAHYVEQAMVAAQTGNIAYAVRDNCSGDIVGTTRFYDVQAAHKRACIGYTWYADRVRRSAINTESKLLLLNHLFTSSGAIAVEFRTHYFNHTSRQAIERLGAKLDGILRSHQIMGDGSLRDTAVYSIVAAEWPAVRNNLQARLHAYTRS
ncbi:GNAT family N-acetyltransferase [Pseudoalteromonas fenneropenaei]|uniref:GNAT family N-acetyltransferase n=1 Tax=Pseudoalteromonas fenneropenaei TaxID=1737459 RepID=A0ABV7CI93_9GAMM